MIITATVAALLAAAVDARVSHVAVYSDRARVTRTVQVEPSAGAVIEFPLLQESVDPATIRVEAQGAEVRRVDIERAGDDAFPTDEARKLLKELRGLEDQLSKARGDRSAHEAQLGLLQRIQPLQPQAEPQRTVPKLNGTGWTAALAFAAAESARHQQALRTLGEELEVLDKKYQEATERARLLGGVGQRRGHRVKATLQGASSAKLSLVYVTGRARWYPLYELQLLPDTGKVQITFSGLVSQESGEDWTDARLTVSTAMPSTATVMPKLPTWKIGDRERFIPTAQPVPEMVRPAPRAPPLLRFEQEEDRLRRKLMAEIGREHLTAAPPPEAPGYDEEDYSADEPSAEPMQPQPMEEARPMPRSMAPPPPPRMQRPERRERSMKKQSRAPAAESMAISTDADGRYELESDGPSAQGFSLAPPPGWVPRPPPPDSPAALAGGYDLAFNSLRTETVATGKGAVRVPLFAETWPVSVERKLFPALAKDSYLVAEIKSPSAQVLPAGNASLFVGEDPAGNARLPLVSPGEAFTLPLGLDRAIKPVRNVKVNQAEKGFIGKEEVTEYVVTTEISNPHSVPVNLRIFDQWPVTDSKGLEVKLLKTDPYAIQDQAKGTLEWRITLQPRQKKTVSFVYTLRRPKGWRLYQ